MPPTALPLSVKGRLTEVPSVTHEVTVTLDDRGVVISRTPGEKPLIWPYGALGIDERLTAQSVSALISYRHQSGASLFVPNAAFARALATAAPHLSQRTALRSWASRAAWAGAAIAGIAAVIWIAGFSPSRSIAAYLPDSMRDTLGKQSLSAMTEGRKVCTAASGRLALDAMADRLSKASGSGKTFKISVVDWELDNAFATPGEYIVVTRGLIEKASSADEIAGVLAHEMGHGLELHPETAIVRAIGLTAATELLIGGGGLANIGLTLAQLSYSRDAEREADARALEILEKAGITHRGLLAFFDRSISDETDKPGVPSIGSIKVLRTHPMTEERRAVVAAHADYPATPAMTTGDWQAFKTICSATKSLDEADKTMPPKEI